MPQQTDYEPSKAEVKLLYDRVWPWVGKDAPRIIAMMNLASWSEYDRTPQRLIDAVLAEFDEDPDPVPGKDFLPDPADYMWQSETPEVRPARSM